MATTGQEVKALYTPTSKNAKTGNIPQSYIGTTCDETNASCEGCPLRIKKVSEDSKRAGKSKVQRFGMGCYAWGGTAVWGLKNMQKAYARGKEYSIDTAIAKSIRSAKYLRQAVIGDPSAVNRDTYFSDEAKARNAGLGVLSYTHFWQTRGAWLKGFAMASCDTVADAEKAVSEGWRAAVHVPEMKDISGDNARLQGKTASGASFTLCPNQRADKADARGNTPQCNDCGLCDATKKAVDIVVFLDH